MTYEEFELIRSGFELLDKHLTNLTRIVADLTIQVERIQQRAEPISLFPPYREDK